MECDHINKRYYVLLIDTKQVTGNSWKSDCVSVSVHSTAMTIL